MYFRTKDTSRSVKLRSLTRPNLITTLAILALLLSAAMAPPSVLAQSIIIDHTCTNLEDIPVEWIVTAQQQFRISYGHTSHGSQPIDGMEVIMNTIPGTYDFNVDGAVTPGVLSITDRTPQYDIGWGNFGDGYASFANRTRYYLDGPGADRNLVIWSWCGQVSDATEEYIDTYLSLMEELESEYPDVTFIYMTGHLNGTGEAGNLNQRNNQIRDYCIANDKILYDFADIESYDPDGEYFLDLGADDACNYSGGNWADEWCADNPGDPLCLECDICAHSKSLNCNLKARAFWWMFARLAGWQELPDTEPPAVPTGIEATQLPPLSP